MSETVNNTENIHQFGLLSEIDSPADLRKLKVEQLPQVCDELRRDIIKELSVNPGHLASSLGVVEITVAMHYVFNTPDDRIVWDVGHQAYGHKILTGRRESFCTNRKLGGLRPFPFPDESEYDSFCCGHASNSISAALGMAVAAHIHKDNRKVVALIGDGAMSGGLAFEGLNNAASTPNDMLIILIGVGLGDQALKLVTGIRHRAHLILIDRQDILGFLGVEHVDGVENRLPEASPRAFLVSGEVERVVDFLAQVDDAPDGPIVHHVSLADRRVGDGFGEITGVDLFPRCFYRFADRLLQRAAVKLVILCECEAGG